MRRSYFARRARFIARSASSRSQAPTGFSPATLSAASYSGGVKFTITRRDCFSLFGFGGRPPNRLVLRCTILVPPEWCNTKRLCASGAGPRTSYRQVVGAVRIGLGVAGLVSGATTARSRTGGEVAHFAQLLERLADRSIHDRGAHVRVRL